MELLRWIRIITSYYWSCYNYANLTFFWKPPRD